MTVDHWVRHVMNERTAEIVRAEHPERLDVLEIGGHEWADFGFKSYRTVDWPEFDICKERLRERYDLIIAEQVFEHLPSPGRAARNVRRMLRPGGMVLITTPVRIKYHPCPGDYSRWTQHGMVRFLWENGFVEPKADSWGNRECLVANLGPWVEFDPAIHSVENEREFPVSVWATARRPRLPADDRLIVAQRVGR